MLGTTTTQIPEKLVVKNFLIRIGISVLWRELLEAWILYIELLGQAGVEWWMAFLNEDKDPSIR